MIKAVELVLAATMQPLLVATKRALLSFLAHTNIFGAESSRR
ncbi:hypothetical protein [Mycobacterium lepromatosis]